MACKVLQSGIASMIFKFSRLAVQSLQAMPAKGHRCIHTQISPLLFHASQQLWSEPIKRKKKVDPAITLAREAKRRKKIEKQMKRLEKYGRKLKPIDEIEGEPKLKREFTLRARELPLLTQEEKESRALLQKQWARYKFRQFAHEAYAISSLLQEQDRALEELRFESPELYKMAIQVDDKLIPFSFKGPTTTPPIKGYEAQDGEYIDTTKTFD